MRAPPEPNQHTTLLAPPPLGDDQGDGSLAAPVATMQRALDLGRPTLLFAAGTYECVPYLRGQHQLFGGLDPAQGWRRGEEKTRLVSELGTGMLELLPGADVRLDGLSLEPSQLCYLALFVSDGARVQLNGCVVTGARAGAISTRGIAEIQGCVVDGRPRPDSGVLCAFGDTTIVDCHIFATRIAVNCTQVHLERCRVVAGTYPVYVQGDDAVILNNELVLQPPTRNARGVFVMGGERLRVEGNTINGRPDREVLDRWAALPRRRWRYNEDSSYDWEELVLTPNGVCYEGRQMREEYTGPTQDYDDFLHQDPIKPLPPELLAEVRDYLRAYGPV